jgi:hypothetical protein
VLLLLSTYTLTKLELNRSNDITKGDTALLHSMCVANDSMFPVHSMVDKVYTLTDFIHTLTDGDVYNDRSIHLLTAVFSIRSRASFGIRKARALITLER